MLNSPLALSARALSVSRGGRDVLHDVSFDVSVGGITGLLGPSGSGKTTLMRAIVGVQRRVRGELTVLGEPAGSAPLRRRVGYRTQDPAVYADLTVRENLEYFAAILGAPRGQVADVIRQVELEDVAGQLARSLSGGQHSRVSLATAFLGAPELLVLDEPTVGLDPVLRETLWQLFRSRRTVGRRCSSPVTSWMKPPAVTRSCSCATARCSCRRRPRRWPGAPEPAISTKRFSG